MSEIAKAYEPEKVETKWTEAWEQARCFAGERPEPGEPIEPFAIVIPPPNVTGVLHMGHILNNTIQDILTRRARQEGKAAVWVPGTDHAGIATQTRVEKALRAEGKSKWDLGREAFVDRAKQWRDEHGGIILKQLRKLGASCDWSRTVHTLDADYSRAVLAAFVELFHKGNIYRGKRMVNWCPKSLTALSDEEVIMKPQSGFLYKMRYPIAERPGEFVEISTTRPETIMGDTGVAVHPEDPRYKHLQGLHAVRPFPEARIPFVFDEHVDREFGTGVLKVTPAHDRADFEIGQRHNLPSPDILTPDGRINCPDCPDLHGLDRFEARKLAAEKLEQLGLLIEREQYENNVGYSERADVPIEPRLSDQWWLRYPRVEAAKEAVASGKISFYPERWTKTYAHWLESIQDWCISRQLWWGHRIPVWYRKGVDRENLSEQDLRDPDKVHVSIDGPADPNNWEQDDDVLDTWASSWLWPFAVFGWTGSVDTDCREDLKFWYPTNVLCTGPDIIFFWVARMIMAGLEFIGDVPFRHVVFNGIIRDAKGRKMSKSLGNSPDPLDLIQTFGADGLRLGMLMIAPKGADILFSEERIQLGRNFCNKLWNAARFRLMQQPRTPHSPATIEALIATLNPETFDSDDETLLERLASTLGETETALRRFEFNHLTDSLYRFFWNDYCDWYLETAKAKIQSDDRKGNCLAIQDLAFRCVLQMLHPITPFITEELWQLLHFGNGFIHQSPIPSEQAFRQALKIEGIEPRASAVVEVARMKDFVAKARALKSQYNLAAKTDTAFQLEASPENRAILDTNREKILRLVGAASISATSQPAGMPSELTDLGTVYLDLAGSVDVEAERIKLKKQLEALQKSIASAVTKLDNPRFAEKAPAHVVDGVRSTLAENRFKEEEVQKLLQAL